MPFSMTGFGRGVVDAPFGRLVVEMQSVNRKYFEVSFSLPREMSSFENELRKWISEKIHRGQVSVRVQLTASKEALLPDLQMLKNLKKGWDKIAKDLKLDPITLPFLVSMLPPNQKTDLIQEKDLPVIQKCVESAIKALLSMKQVEGKALVKDIEKRLVTLRKNLASIEKFAPEATSKMRQKLTEKMNALFLPGQEIDDRIVKEIAFYAEKVDISEEITRLKSHFAQFEECLKAQESIGRKLEFVIQEMGREVNTIGSKCSDANISYVVVEMKSEIEKIREQIQNIE